MTFSKLNRLKETTIRDGSAAIIRDVRRRVRNAPQLTVQSHDQLRKLEALAGVNASTHRGDDGRLREGRGRQRSPIISREFPAAVTPRLTMYGHTTYNDPPTTPPRSLRPSTSAFTAQTPTRSHPGSALLPPSPKTARSSVTTVTATGAGDTGNGNPTLITYTTISQEYASLRYPGHCPLGMYLIPNKDNMFVWDGVFFVHQGSFRTLVPRNLRRANVPSFLHLAFISLYSPVSTYACRRYADMPNHP